MLIPKGLIRKNEAALMLGTTVTTMAKSEKRGEMPETVPMVPGGKQQFYRLSDIQKIIDERDS